MPMPILIPAHPAPNLRPSSIVAQGLLNPRGLCLQSDGSLLMAEAGSGLPDQSFSGRISRLRPDPDMPGAWECRFGMPASTGPLSRSAPSALALGSTLISRPSDRKSVV